MQHTTGSFTTHDHLTLFTQHWSVTPPRAVILLVHGYGEHSNRYTHVTQHLTAHGYAVYALDLRGHGRSGGVRTKVNDFDEFTTDLRLYFEQIRAEYADLPVFLYGHSMGSLIALLFAARWQNDLAGLITTGTALHAPGINRYVAAMLNLLRRVGPSVRMVPALVATGISRDLAVVEAYIADPLVYHKRFRLDMAAAMARAALRARAVLPDLRLPYLALHGGADPITLPGGAEIVRQHSGAPDTTVKVYEGLYHEIHNEPEQRQVFDDITAWLDAHTENPA